MFNKFGVIKYILLPFLFLLFVSFLAAKPSFAACDTNCAGGNWSYTCDFANNCHFATCTISGVCSWTDPTCYPGTAGLCPTPTPTPTPAPTCDTFCVGGTWSYTCGCSASDGSLGHKSTCTQSGVCTWTDPTCYAGTSVCGPLNGYTVTNQTCNSSGQWVTTGTPTCQNSCPGLPDCDANGCGLCNVACGGGTKTCHFTTHTGGGNCNVVDRTIFCNTNICPTPTPTYNISGNVFSDANKNTLKDGGETNYTGAITITSTGGSVSTGAGSYTVSNLSGGTYTVSYTNLPTGYSLTYPLNGPPPSFTITVGGSCSAGGSNSASCSGGSIINLNFGITNSQPWIQCIGADCRIDSGFISRIPSTTATCGPYANLPGNGGTPGLIFTGDSNADFGEGQASSTGWVVGGSNPTLSEVYSPTKVGGQVKTSYNFLLSKATQGNLTINDLASYCTGGIGNCSLQALPSGIYRASGNLRLVGGSYTFAASTNAIILVNGNLNIATRILVPNGSTATFSTSGNIVAETGIGEAAITSTNSTIAGIYSAGGSFIVQGNNNCTTGADLRFNVGGAVITNAALSGGSFQNQRNLCGGNAQCPAFSVKERADFIINSPDFLKQPNFTYQEIAP